MARFDVQADDAGAVRRRHAGDARDPAGVWTGQVRLRRSGARRRQVKHEEKKTASGVTIGTYLTEGNAASAAQAPARRDRGLPEEVLGPPRARTRTTASTSSRTGSRPATACRSSRCSAATYIERFKAAAGEDFMVFNGPDEQYVSGRLIGADSGIGGTYAAMPELLLKAEEFVATGNFEQARNIQRDINDIITALVSLNGHMYSAIKELLKLRGVNIGSVRGPLEPVTGEDLNKVAEIRDMIDHAIRRY